MQGGITRTCEARPLPEWPLPIPSNNGVEGERGGAVMIGKDPPPLSATEVCARCVQRQGTRPDAIAAKLGISGVLKVTVKGGSRTVSLNWFDRPRRGRRN